MAALVVQSTPALDQAVAEMLLNGLTGNVAFTATTAPTKLRLMMSAPTATVPGTELPNGGGYTAGGTTITWWGGAGGLTNAQPTATGGVIYNSNALSWTNSSGSAWNIVGGEIWDSAGTPRRLAFGLWDDQPLTIGNGSPFSVAINSIAWTFP